MQVIPVNQDPSLPVADSWSNDYRNFKNKQFFHRLKNRYRFSLEMSCLYAFLIDVGQCSIHVAVSPGDHQNVFNAFLMTGQEYLLFCTELDDFRFLCEQDVYEEGIAENIQFPNQAILRVVVLPFNHMFIHTLPMRQGRNICLLAKDAIYNIYVILPNIRFDDNIFDLNLPQVELVNLPESHVDLPLNHFVRLNVLQNFQFLQDLRCIRFNIKVDELIDSVSDEEILGEPAQAPVQEPGISDEEEEAQSASSGSTFSIPDDFIMGLALIGGTWEADFKYSGIENMQDDQVLTGKIDLEMNSLYRFKVMVGGTGTITAGDGQLKFYATLLAGRDYILLCTENDSFTVNGVGDFYNQGEQFATLRVVTVQSQSERIFAIPMRADRLIALVAKNGSSYRVVGTQDDTFDGSDYLNVQAQVYIVNNDHEIVPVTIGQTLDVQVEILEEVSTAMIFFDVNVN